MKNKFLKKALNWSMVLVAATMILGSCSKDEEKPPVVIEDGIYVKGAGTALTGYDAKGLMTATTNEADGNSARASLYELYVPVKAGDQGFNIIIVTGGEPTIYGPGNDFTDIGTDRNVEEPQGDFWRGSYADVQTSVNPFTVNTDGFYHVVLDTELGVVAIAEVEWGVIGGATPIGWGGSTAMTASAFDLNTMTYTVTDLELRGGDWKFRYSGGWKIELDTVSTPNVKVNTNFGGAVDALVAGGGNFVNDDPGVYDITLAYTLGTGYTATAVKTGALPLTNWTGVVLDAVGTGVDPANANAITPDPSGWNWGSKLLADNAGVPVVAGDSYAWTWTNILLVTGEGFKLRTEDGVVPANGNGAGFDAGFSAVDVGASSGLVADSGGNLSVTLGGTFNISITIDAANNDSKTIVITEAAK